MKKNKNYVDLKDQPVPEGQHLLEVDDLKMYFHTEDGVVRAVDGVSYTLDRGETLGVVGESGSGKSVTAMTIMGLISMPPGKIEGGDVRYRGRSILEMTEEEMQHIRGNDIAMIFQDPMTSLNPVYKIGRQVGEGLRLHRGYSKQEALKRATELLDLVGIPEPEKRVNEYPHQFSGGMRQRVMIAMALACDPDILIADEPTTALDVTIQAQIIELMQEMQEKNGNAIIMITHDLGVVADMADKIMVMYAGRPVEFGTAEEIFYESRHPYTWGLIRSIPEQAIDEKKPLTPIHGNPPSLMNLPEGCVFSPRCPYATDKCRKQRPERVVTESGHYSACHYSGDPEFLVFVRCFLDTNERTPLLKVEHLSKEFPAESGMFAKRFSKRVVSAVNDISFEIYPGETFGLVGESGCGKSTTGRTIMRLTKPTAGKVFFQGKDVAEMSKHEIKDMRREMQFIFQDPYASLNPRMTIGEIVSEPMTIHGVGTKEERIERVRELLDVVGLNPEHINRYPHEFSGGQRQRVGIARAFALKPKLIICDEPVSALDVSIQAQVLNLLKELQDKFGTAYLFIAHDLSVVQHISDRVAVMYLGKMVEVSDWKTLYSEPHHPYTQSLLSAVPVPDPDIQKTRKRIILAGDPPSPLDPPTGCRFHTRCPIAQGVCSEKLPEFKEVAPGHCCACHFAEPFPIKESHIDL